jgi:UPF0716 protein FxsA
MRWFLLFLAVPIFEIIVFVEISKLLGTVGTIFIIVATAAVGTILVRRQGLELLSHFKLGESNPISLLTTGLFILLAGIFLLTPGFITDIVGFLFLIPSIRHRILVYSKKLFISK